LRSLQVLQNSRVQFIGTMQQGIQSVIGVCVCRVHGCSILPAERSEATADTLAMRLHPLETESGAEAPRSIRVAVAKIRV